MNNNVFYLQAWFSGHVQGVGFRYKVRQIASEFIVCGTVKNLDDGRVSLEAEGEEQEVLAFLKTIEEHMESFIREVVTQSSTRAACFKGFTISL